MRLALEGVFKIIFKINDLQQKDTTSNTKFRDLRSNLPIVPNNSPSVTLEGFLVQMWTFQLIKCVVIFYGTGE